MESQRVILFGALMFVVFSLWNAWQHDYPKTTAVQSAAVTTTTSTNLTSTSAGSTPISQNLVATPQTAEVSVNKTVAPVEVTTDVLKILIDPRGGNIVKAVLVKYPQSVEDKNTPFVLLNNDPNMLYVAQSGLIGAEGPDTSKQQALYQANQTTYVMDADQSDLTVPLTWKNAEGLLITKTFHFKRSNYAVDVDYEVENRSSKTWSGQLYTQFLQKRLAAPSGGMFNISSYTGAAISSPEKRYQKISFDQITKNNLERNIQGGWLAMQQHYFLSAWIPDPAQTFNYFTQYKEGDVYVIGSVGPILQAQPGETIKTGVKLYVGPELMDQLRAIAPGLELTIDFGWLWFVSIGIFWCMKLIYSVVGNWGWSIVLVTLFIKLAFYRLSASSYKSMASMRKMQPKIEALRERYGSDKQKMSQAMMELYKKEKINPLGGCLPILVQIPVFIALYWVLLESVDLRQAPFILWIHDLSAKDPWHVLPLLMGLTMWLQQRLSPAPADPTQAKVMLLMPVLMTALFWNFPAGLVLYWVVNNTLSIAQQWYIMRKQGALG